MQFWIGYVLGIVTTIIVIFFWASFATAKIEDERMEAEQKKNDLFKGQDNWD
jgi:H+/gluconate symporter-like permease